MRRTMWQTYSALGRKFQRSTGTCDSTTPAEWRVRAVQEGQAPMMKTARVRGSTYSAGRPAVNASGCYAEHHTAEHTAEPLSARGNSNAAEQRTKASRHTAPPAARLVGSTSLQTQRTGHNVSPFLQLGQVRTADEGALGLDLGCATQTHKRGVCGRDRQRIDVAQHDGEARKPGTRGWHSAGLAQRNWRRQHERLPCRRAQREGCSSPQMCRPSIGMTADSSRHHCVNGLRPVRSSKPMRLPQDGIDRKRPTGGRASTHRRQSLGHLHWALLRHTM
jgi:hypothetical protein